MEHLDRLLPKNGASWHTQGPKRPGPNTHTNTHTGQKDERWNILTGKDGASWHTQGSKRPDTYTHTHRTKRVTWNILTGCCQRMEHPDIHEDPNAQTHTHTHTGLRVTWQKTKHLDRLLPKDVASWHTLGPKLPDTHTDSYIQRTKGSPDERQNILSGCYQRMEHPDIHKDHTLVTLTYTEDTRVTWQKMKQRIKRKAIQFLFNIHLARNIQINVT